MKNGTLATIERAAPDKLAVRLDDGWQIEVDLKSYAHVDHGYAATVHKTQGMTVDRTHVLATPGLDAHATYVALSRHRDGTALHYARDEFADMAALTRTLARERPKDMASDYEGRSLQRPALDVSSTARGSDAASACAGTSTAPINSRSRSAEADVTQPPQAGREEGRGLFDALRRAFGLARSEAVVPHDAVRSGESATTRAAQFELSAKSDAPERLGPRDSAAPPDREAVEAGNQRAGSTNTQPAAQAARDPANSDYAREMRAMIQAHVNAPSPTSAEFRAAVAAAAHAPERGMGRDNDYGAEQ